MYTMHVLKMNRQRGGVSSAYVIFLDGKMFRIFGRKSAAEKFLKSVKG